MKQNKSRIINLIGNNMKKLIIVIAVLTSSAFSQIQFSCEFDKYSNKDGAIIPDNPLVFKLNILTATSFTMESSMGSTKVTLLKRQVGEPWVFMEVSETGNIFTTTIKHGGEAVHSRNTVMGGALVPSQHYGRCTTRVIGKFPKRKNK